MKPEFGLKRETNNKLWYKDAENDKGVFHFHSQIELYFITDGEMEVFINDQHKVLKKGEMSVALSFTPHGYKTPRYSRSSYLDIPTYMCKEFIVATQGKTMDNPFICNTELVNKIYGYFNELRKESINEIERLGYLYLILGLVMNNIALKNTQGASEISLTTKILTYINNNYTENISSASIAKHFGYTQSHISRYFKSTVNISLTKYLTIIRLKSAITLMRENRHNITYCALESGFTSVRTFYRSFFAEFGCSPKEYMLHLDA